MLHPAVPPVRFPLNILQANLTPAATSEAWSVPRSCHSSLTSREGMHSPSTPTRCYGPNIAMDAQDLQLIFSGDRRYIVALAVGSWTLNLRTVSFPDSRSRSTSEISANETVLHTHLGYVLHPCIAASTSALGKDQHTTPPCESDNGGVVMAPSRTPSAAS